MGPSRVGGERESNKDGLDSCYSSINMSDSIDLFHIVSQMPSLSSGHRTSSPRPQLGTWLRFHAKVQNGSFGFVGRDASQMGPTRGGDCQ